MLSRCLLLLLSCTLSLELVAVEYRNDKDPWESFNRKVYAANEVADAYFLKPVAKGYRNATPQFVDDGVSNFFANLNELTTVANSLLQGKFRSAGVSGGRFVINSTFGFAGFFDVASKFRITHYDEDYGQTLAYWGIESGPYVVLPFLGPSTVRESVALVPDWILSPQGLLTDHIATKNTMTGVRLIDKRADLLAAESFIFGDKYSFLRDAYLQQRAYKNNDGVVEDDFGDGADEGDFF